MIHRIVREGKEDVWGRIRYADTEKIVVAKSDGRTETISRKCSRIDEFPEETDWGKEAER